MITTPTDGSVLAFSTVTIEGTAAPGSSVEVMVSTAGTFVALVDSSGRWSVSRTFSDALHTVRAVARDPSGAESAPSSPVTFRVDTVPPAAPIVYTPARGSATNQTTVVVSGAAEPGAVVTLYEGVPVGSTTARENGTFSVAASFNEGAHSFTARATDAAGHTSVPSATVSFVVDLTLPSAPSVSVPREGEIVSPSLAVVAGRAEPSVTVHVLRGSFVIALTTAAPDGSWSVPLRLEDGIVTVTARARDAAGNNGPTSEPRRFVVDATPPSVTVKTADGTVFGPADPVRIEGRATDTWGVASVTLDFYDVAGRGVASARATCIGCPQAGDVAWSSGHTPLPGRYVVRAYALDRVGNKSAPISRAIVVARLG